MRYILISTLFQLFMAITVSAQHVKSDPSYWVVETNINNRSYSIVRFYDRHNSLLHEVTLNGIYIDVRMPKHKRKLDQLLKDYTQRAMASAKRNKPKRSV